MSAESQPITAAAFASAIKSLPLSSVYAKAIELRNSIAHLVRSNEELKEYICTSSSSMSTTEASANAEAENRELESYVLENEGVIEAMKSRMELCRAEVEERGQLWLDELDGPSDGDVRPKLAALEDDGEIRLNGVNGTTSEEEDGPQTQRSNDVLRSTTISRTSEITSNQHNDADMEEDDEGIHL
jgi:hypothetical protein